MSKLSGRTEALIHLSAIEANVANVRSRLSKETELIAVLKGDAYGHGIAGVYPTLRRAGITRYAVAIWEEGAMLRNAGAATEEILLLGDVWDGHLEEVLRYDLTPCCFSLEMAKRLQDLAAKSGKTASVHIKIDTGMSRIGFPWGETAAQAMKEISQYPNIRMTGVFTHFYRSDELDGAMSYVQSERFEKTLALAEEMGVSIPLRHTSSSPTIMNCPEYSYDAMRPGDLLFGLCPINEEDRWATEGFQEVLTWRTYVALVKTIPVGTDIGYGGTFCAPREMTIATIPVGFADGYSRALSNRGTVLIRGKEAPIVGRVCMDQFMVDVTDIPGVTRGDEVTLLGGSLSILRMANLLGVNVDEVVVGITKRVPRVYVEE